MYGNLQSLQAEKNIPITFVVFGAILIIAAGVNIKSASDAIACASCPKKNKSSNCSTAAASIAMSSIVLIIGILLVIFSAMRLAGKDKMA